MPDPEGLALVVAALELDVDLRPCLLRPVARLDQAVVRENEPEDSDHDDRDQDPDPTQLELILALTANRSLRVRATLPARLLQHLLVLVLAHLLAPLLDYGAQIIS